MSRSFLCHVAQRFTVILVKLITGINGIKYIQEERERERERD